MVHTALRGLALLLIGLLPWRLFQPTFEAITGAITHLTQLVSPALGPLQQILSDTGSRQGQILQTDQAGQHDTGLLINDAIRCQTPP